MANLKRKQIYLDEECDRALKRLAITTRISESEHIRRAVPFSVCLFCHNDRACSASQGTI